jgi:hypothetical protein
VVELKPEVADTGSLLIIVFWEEVVDGDVTVASLLFCTGSSYIKAAAPSAAEMTSFGKFTQDFP